ncbi:hypothetical protein Dsin_031399 [Dipteronia sinensis]|uniref:Diacylglycerol O-acyltransferase n=1 Tax=Dipteronia sinensis TaxID=43782 RepID=A0AAE0DS60_9ROSI|nr:hypothetical protein Dsin_031399 [Dipteronia sinensis]
MEFKGMEEAAAVPVSPIGYYFNSSLMSISILCVLETEVAIDDSPAFSLLHDVFLPITPRFSSIIVADKKGVRKWKKVEVNLKDHVKVPIFPSGKSPQFYEKCLQDYLSKLSMEELPQSQPLWQLHIIKYSTNNAAGTLIFNLHHALGDGFSLMGALLSCLQRADDPSKPLTFPSVKTRPILNHNNNNVHSMFRNVPRFFSSMFNTASDLYCSIVKSSLIEDDQTPIRSGNDVVRWGPRSIATMAFPLHQIKQIKANLGATINDVVTGIIFLGTRLYMQEVSKESSNLNSTAIVLLNTRMFRSFTSVKEMVKPDAKSPWGNHFAFLHVPIPKFTDSGLSDPLEFIKKAQQIIKSKRNSLGVYLNAKLLEAVDKFRGPGAATKYVHGSLKNSSMAISNMIGPMEQVSVANHPVKGLYFLVPGPPLSLIVTVISYMDKVRVAIAVEDGFIDSQKLKSCMENAYDMMLKATTSATTT